MTPQKVRRVRRVRRGVRTPAALTVVDQLGVHQVAVEEVSNDTVHVETSI